MYCIYIVRKIKNLRCQCDFVYRRIFCFNVGYNTKYYKLTYLIITKYHKYASLQMQSHHQRCTYWTEGCCEYDLWTTFSDDLQLLVLPPLHIFTVDPFFTCFSCLAGGAQNVSCCFANACASCNWIAAPCKAVFMAVCVYSCTKWTDPQLVFSY